MESCSLRGHILDPSCDMTCGISGGHENREIGGQDGDGWNCYLSTVMVRRQTGKSSTSRMTCTSVGQSIKHS